MSMEESLILSDKEESRKDRRNRFLVLFLGIPGIFTLVVLTVTLALLNLPIRIALN